MTSSLRPCPSPEEVTTFAEPARPGGLLVGELALRYLAHAKAYYARDGVPTGEHVTIRSSLAPLTKRFADLPVTELRAEEAQASP